MTHLVFCELLPYRAKGSCYRPSVFVCQQCAATFSESGFCAHDGSPLQPRLSDALIGTKVGPYEIDSLIGVGGMGRVYKAVHPKIGSRVAVKVLSHDCAHKPELIARFFDEARAVNVIRHESIVNILDLDYLPDRRPYIVMEFLDGQPLSNYTKAGVGLPIGTTLRIFEDVLAALEAAHQKRIVHRDLKPDNIFISPKGRPTVLDFGIAKLATHDASLQRQTQAGSLLGTPHYMSPEQARGHPVDARSDLYSIGVILYECLTGQVPFDSESLLVLLQLHVDAQPKAPRSLRSELSVGMQGIVLRALAKDPSQRWQSASELLLALQLEQQGLDDSEWLPIATGGTASGGSHSPSRPPSAGSAQRAENLQADNVRRAAVSAPPPVRTRTRSLRALMLVLGAVALVGLVWVFQMNRTSETAVDGVAQVVTEEVEDQRSLAVPTLDASTLAAPTVDASTLAVPTLDASTLAAPDLRPVRDASARNKPVSVASEDATKVKKLHNTGALLTVPVRNSTKTNSSGQFDVSGYIGKAQARAQEAFPDAVLVQGNRVLTCCTCKQLN